MTSAWCSSSTHCHTSAYSRPSALGHTCSGSPHLSHPSVTSDMSAADEVPAHIVEHVGQACVHYCEFTNAATAALAARMAQLLLQGFHNAAYSEAIDAAVIVASCITQPDDLRLIQPCPGLLTQIGKALTVLPQLVAQAAAKGMEWQ